MNAIELLNGIAIGIFMAMIVIPFAIMMIWVQHLTGFCRDYGVENKLEVRDSIIGWCEYRDKSDGYWHMAD